VYSRFSESVLLLLTIGVLFTGIAGTARLLTKKQGPIPNLNWDAPHLTRTYMAAGLSLLGVAILVPCLGFFKFAHDAANELAAKHGQLMVASDLSDRQRRINDYYQDLYVPRDTPKDRSKEHLDRYDDVALSFLSFSPQPKKTPLDGDDSTFQKAFDDWLTWASHLFPYNKLGGEMRMLQFESTNINPAKWIELPDNSFRLEIGDRTIDSRFLDWPGVRNGGWLALGMVWVLVGYWLLNLVDKIFLPESQSPLLLKRVQWSSTKDIDANYLVLSEPHSGRHRRLEAIEGIEWFDLRVDLEQNNDKHVFNEAIVVLDHFDFNIHNRHDNELRLQLVERLLYKQRCRIVLISSMDPAYFLMEGDSSLLADKPDAAAELLSRWTKVMSTFQIVAFESTRSRFDDQLLQIRSGPLQRIAQWIWSECGQTSYLRKLGLVVLHNNHKADRFEPRALSNEVAERAQSYYALLWSSLTAGEHLALYQLAKDGWANPKNERAIRHLQLKGLVRAEPMLRIMNESFRLFVLNAQNEREIADWEGQGAQSSWRSLKFSLIATAVALAAWLFYAQKDLFQSAIGYVVTLGAAATAIANFLGGFKGRPAPKKEAESA
jgi:hypothetical protein